MIFKLSFLSHFPGLVNRPSIPGPPFTKICIPKFVRNFFAQAQIQNLLTFVS